ncbi:FadR/GntR family transcriptional regulator [Hoeflea sp. CAU 1731]
MTDDFRQLSQKLSPTQPLPSRVASILSQEISSGRLKPGDRLPTEHQIAESLGISRNVVREAISQLRADGLVRARQGAGAFVMEPEERLAIRLDPTDLENIEGMEGLFELRALLEGEAARLAAMRRTDEDLAEISAALEDMRGDEKWSEGSIEADLLFHRTIAKATGNSYIHTFVCFICDQIRRSIHMARYANQIEQLVEVNVGEHVVILDALVAGDPEAARVAMVHHITEAGRRIGIIIRNEQDKTGKGNAES